MGFILKTALRYLKAKKAHSAVNIISIISVCGVVLTTAALVCVLSVFNGFSGLMSDKLAKLDPPISISPAEGKIIGNADSLLNILRNIKGVEIALPAITDQALAIYAEKQVPVTVKGVPEDFNKLTDIEDVILYGNYALSDSSAGYAILSIGVAGSLHSSNGFFDYMRLYVPKRKGNINPVYPAKAFRTDSLYISAIYQADQSSYDRDMVYIPIDAARRLFDYTTEATHIEVKPTKNADETAIIKRIESALGNNYSVKDRLQQQATAFKMVNMEKWVTFLLLSFILIIAAFNVISSLSLLIIEKDESIRTFHNIGATNRQISMIFITEGLLISLTGAIIGIAIGVILCLMQQELGLIKLAGDSETIIVDSYPVKLLWSDLTIVFALVSAVGVLTSFITATLMRSRLKSKL